MYKSYSKNYNFSVKSAILDYRNNSLVQATRVCTVMEYIIHIIFFFALTLDVALYVEKNNKYVNQKLKLDFSY